MNRLIVVLALCLFLVACKPATPLHQPLEFETRVLIDEALQEQEDVPEEPSPTKEDEIKVSVNRAKKSNRETSRESEDDDTSSTVSSPISQANPSPQPNPPPSEPVSPTQIPTEAVTEQNVQPLTEEPVAPQQPEAGPALSMWVWNNDVDIENPASLFDFAQEHKINNLYVGINNNYFDQDTSALLNFLSQAKQRNLAIYYLHGDPSWATSQGLTSLQEVVGVYYQFKTQNPDLFSGIHLDIERTTDWFMNDAQIAKEFLGNLKSLHEAYSDLQLSLDIPFWLDTHEESSSFSFENQNAKLHTHLRRYTEFLTVMDYRNYATNGADGIIENIAIEMEEGATVIGLEFSDVQPEKITFFTKDESYLEKELDVVTEHFENHPNFAGFSFHSYASLQEFYS